MAFARVDHRQTRRPRAVDQPGDRRHDGLQGPDVITQRGAEAAILDEVALHVDDDQRRARRVEVEGIGPRPVDPRHHACPPMWWPISARLAVAAGVS